MDGPERIFVERAEQDVVAAERLRQDDALPVEVDSALILDLSHMIGGSCSE